MHLSVKFDPLFFTMARQKTCSLLVFALLTSALYASFLFQPQQNKHLVNTETVYIHELVLFFTSDLSHLQIPALKVEHTPVNLAEKNLALKTNWSNFASEIHNFTLLQNNLPRSLQTLSQGFISFRKLRI